MHIHLDKALLTERVSGSAETASEATGLTGAGEAAFSPPTISPPAARNKTEKAVAAGTTAMRAHVEVDPIVELMGMDAMLALKREYAPAVDSNT